MLHLLKQRSFGAMTLSQFLGAFNDNAFKQLVLLLIATVAGGKEDALGWVAESSLSDLGQALPLTLFALPFVIFGPITGALADRLSKSRIIKAANVLEIVVMGVATLAFTLERYDFLLGTIFLMGTQSAIFGPSKYGVIKELVGQKELSPANALIQSSTMIAVLAGVVLGGLLAKHLQGVLWAAGLWYMSFATLGWLASLRIARLPAVNPTRRIDWNPVREFLRHWRATDRNRHLILSICASALFYLLAATFLPIVNAYGTETLGLEEDAVSVLNAFTIVGIAIGALWAGRISKSRIEGGLVPLGLLGMAASSFLVQLRPDSAFLLRVSLFGLGVGAGLFTIPIRCLIQHLPREENRGGVQGLAETMDFVGILLAGALFYLFDKGLDLRPPQMFAVCGVILSAYAVTSLLLFGGFAVRVVLLIMTHTVYRLRVRGLERVPDGGALLVANHVSFVDAVLIGAASPRPVRFLMQRDYFRAPLVGWFARKMGAIPIASGDSREDLRSSLEGAAEAARNGELVCIFAEGAITRTGGMLPFARGLERVARAAEVPIVPVALDRLWGSLFSYEGGRFFWKLPQQIPYPVDLTFGAPVPSDTPAHLVRNQVQELVAETRAARGGRRESLGWRLAVTAKCHARRTAVVDSTGKRLTFRRLLAGSLVLRGVLRRRLRPAQRVAVLLPPGVGGALVNTSLALDRRTSVNLNYTMPNSALAGMLERAEVEQVITSPRFLEALERPSPLPPERTLMVEDLLAEASRGQRLRAYLATFLPTWILARIVVPQPAREEVATVLFSSGSSGEPKGVELTHGNVLSNVESVLQVLPLGPGDTVLGVLPFFHSFGYTVTLWATILSGAKAAYHANPLDAKRIGKLAEKERATLLLATPTFYQGWLRRIPPEAFATVRIAVSGAEKLRDALADAWEERYGISLLEGYGCTECAPVVSFNLPQVDGLADRQQPLKRGTLGRPLPGVALRVVDPETRELLAVGESGLLEVKGPNVMKGYLKDPERTAQVLRDGWYSTGDIARVDRDGFLVVTDRLSRFSKIGGEMVPHGRVEEELTEVVGRLSEGREDLPEVAVTALPDERKGEQLVVLHTAMPFPVARALDELGRKDLPQLFLPREKNFVQVEEIPRLGTGKIDLKGLRELARERLQPQ